MRTKFALAAAAALVAGSVSAASAADLRVAPAPPPPPPYNWTGYWLGFGIGGFFGGESTVTFPGGLIGGPGGLLGGAIAPEINQPIVAFHGTHTHQLAGFGWGNLVIGIDQSANLPLDNDLDTVACPNALLSCGVRIQSLFTTGALLGLAWDRVLFSVRGGWAAGLVQTRTFTNPAGILFDNTSRWHSGWYVGGAIDWAVYKTAGTSGVLGIEYNYVDLGDIVHCQFGCGPAPGFVRNVDVTANVIKAKFSIKLDGPPLLPF
jgi:outer membrane immunogenic protein